jgi:hypothetical protein
MRHNRKKQRRSGLRFDVAVNGERICLAGSGRYGVLSLAVTWVRRDPRKRPQTQTVEKWHRGECSLRIGALTGGFQESWEAQPVKQGDEITIRILGAGLSELPPLRSRAIRPKAMVSKPPKFAVRDGGESAARWEGERNEPLT